LRLHTALRTVGVLGMEGSTTCIPIYDVMSYQLVYVFFLNVGCILGPKARKQAVIVVLLQGVQIIFATKATGRSFGGSNLSICITLSDHRRCPPRAHGSHKASPRLARGARCSDKNA
jgi:hypothetical protein